MSNFPTEKLANPPTLATIILDRISKPPTPSALEFHNLPQRNSNARGALHITITLLIELFLKNAIGSQDISTTRYASKTRQVY